MTGDSDGKAGVGLIGLGNMGRGVGRNLIRNGFPPTVVDRDAERVAELVSWGARDAGGVGGMLAVADVVITCLPDPATIRDVYLGANGLAGLAREGTVLVDCSTSDPLLTREIGARARGRGVALIDAPMLRTPSAAWDGTLQLVVGGEASDVERARPVLEAFTEEIIPVGALGNGHATKLINNAVGLGTQALICEAFNVARTLGVDLTTLHKVMQVGNAASRKLDELAPRIINDEHSITFTVDLCLKD